MTISFVSQGTTPTAAATGTGTTSVTAALPTTMVDNDIVFLYVGNKPDTSSPATPTGWTLVGTVAGGAGVVGADTGPVRTTVFYRVKDASWSTMPAVTIASNSAAIAQAFVYRNSTGLWSVAASGGADTTVGAAWSVTAASDPGFSGGDWALVCSTIPTDVTTPAQFTLEAIASTGITWGTMTERSEPETTSGNQVAGFVFDRPATSGTSTAAPVVTATVATTNTNVAGTSLVIRLREAPAITFPQADSSSPAVYKNFTSGNAISPSFTPPANSTIVVGYTSDGAQSSASTITNSAGLTFTLYSQRYLSIPSGNTDHGHVALWAAHIGASPGPMTITVNNGEGTALNKMLIVKVYLDTDVDPVTPIGNVVDGAFTSGTTLSATLTPQTTGGGTRMLWLDWNATGIPTSFLPNNTQTVIVDSVHSAGNSTNIQIAKNTPTTAGVAETIGANLLASSTDGNYIAYELRAPAAATTPASASDTTAISVAETSSVSVTNAASDTTAISVVETASIVKTSATSDTGSIAVGETSAVAVTSGTSDTGSLAVSETSSITVTITASDTTAISVAESRTTGVTVSATDTTAVSVAESQTSLGALAASDTTAVSVAEAQASNSNLSANDTGAVSVAEAQNSSSTLAASDTTAVSVAETTAFVRNISASDTGSVSVNEVSNAGTSSLGTETVAVGVTEQTNILVIVTASDTGSISVSEFKALDSFTTSTDTGSIAVDDSSSSFLTLASSDTGSIATADSTASALTNSASDTGSIAVTESTAFVRNISSTDTTAISVSDASATYIPTPGSDTGSIAVSETSSVVISGANTATGSDTGSVSVAETSNVASFVSASDTGAISVSETNVLASSTSGTDNVAITVTETATVLRQFGSSDSAAISVSETASAVALEPPPSSVPGSDGGSIGVTETSNVVVLGIVTKTASDFVSVSVTETAGNAVSITRNDNVAVSVNDSSQSFLTSFRTDTGSIHLDESQSSVSKVTAFDNVVVSEVESVNVLPIEGFVQKFATDSVSIAVTEIRNISDPTALEHAVFLGGEVSVQTYLATETETGTMVNRQDAITERVEGDSEGQIRVE